MKQTGSNFVTPAGLAILVLLVLLSAYLKISGLLAISLAVLLLCAAAYLWSRGALGHIDVEIDQEDACAFPGEELSAGAKLHNRKFLPVLWLEAGFSLGGCTCVAPLPEDIPADTEEGEEPELKETFLWVMPQQSIEWRQKASAVHRGVCAVREMELRSGDGFGLTGRKKEAKLPAGFRFVVYPEVKPVDVTPIVNNMREMEPSSRGFYTDNTLISNIRDYRDGDSFRDINWRMLARQGTVQVNVHEKLDMRRVCLMADVESFTYIEVVDIGGERHTERRVHTDELERMLSLLASVIVRLHERGVLCSLVIPAFGENEAHLVMPEEREMQVMQLLTALAELDYKAEKTVFPAEAILADYHRLGQLFLFTYQAERKESAVETALDGTPLFKVVQKDEGSEGMSRIITETELAWL